MNVILNDRETATLIDCLAIVRDRLRDQGLTGNDADSALSKINSLMTPSVWGLKISVADRPA